MSIITIPVGQCGIQIAHSLYNYLYEDIANIEGNGATFNVNNCKSSYSRESCVKWFQIKKNGLIQPRSVLVDTENKVTNFIINDKSAFKFKHILSRCDGGSANNFACGYTAKSKIIAEDCLDKIRQEVEQCDFISDIMGIFSSAGGTGSGLGTYLLQKVHEEFPKKAITSCIVLPYLNGDVLTQSYNTLFTLSKLYPTVDGCIIFDNDSLHTICSKKLTIRNVNFEDMNKIASQHMAALLQPTDCNNSLNEMVLNLTSHPSFKLLQIKCGPFRNTEYKKFETKAEWQAIFKNCLKDIKLGLSSSGINFKTIGNALVTRGGIRPCMDDLRQFNDDKIYPDWLPSEARFNLFHQINQLRSQDAFFTLATNNNGISVNLNTVLEDAWNLFSYKAYIHHYEKFGYDESCFKESFVNLETIYHDYKCL